METPLDWANDAVRYDFFAQLPRPLAVMLACDLAAMPPQAPVGAAAIEASRRWIMGAADPRDVRAAARAAAWQARDTADPAYAAAAAANTVSTAVWYLAYSASSVCEAVDQCGLKQEVVGFAAQSRRVEFLRQAMTEDHVRLLANAGRDDPAVRPILWDAMLEAGYTPQPLQLASERPSDPQAAPPALTSKVLRTIFPWPR
jgi:hypothetical protein